MSLVSVLLLLELVLVLSVLDEIASLFVLLLPAVDTSLVLVLMLLLLVEMASVFVVVLSELDIAFEFVLIELELDGITLKLVPPKFKGIGLEFVLMLSELVEILAEFVLIILLLV